MKVNIQKFQGGGFATFTPIIHTSPTTGQTSGNSTSTPAQQSASILDDDTFKELLTKGGLTNDVNAFVSQLVELEQSQASGYPYTNAGTRGSALRIVAQVNSLKNSKDNWEKSVQIAKESGGLDEVAVSNSQLYVKDEKGIVKNVSLSDYKKVAGKVKVLTVGELLNERQLNPNLVGRNDVFNAANNSIGLEKITDTITNLISAISVEEVKDERLYPRATFEKQKAAFEKQFTGTDVKPTNEEMKSMSELKTMLTNPSEYFKVATSVKSKQKYLESAYNYLWKAIGTAGQQKLAAISAISGENNPKKYIEDLLISQTTPSTDTTVLPASATGGTGSSNTSDSNLRSLTQWQLFNKEKLRTPDLSMAFNDPVAKVVFRGTVGSIGPLITPKGDLIPPTTIKQILESGWGQLVEQSKVFFGNKQVSPAELTSLAFNGSDDVAKVYMPVGKNEEPDYEELKNWNVPYTLYEANKDKWSVKEIQDHFKKYNYNITVDETYEDGEKVRTIRDNKDIKPFLVIPAYTSDATNLIPNENKPWVTKLTSDEKDLIMPTLEEAWTMGTGKNRIDLKPKDRLGFNDKFYKGLVAIPYRKGSNAMADAMVGQGPKDKPTTMSDVQWNMKAKPVVGTSALQIQN